MGRLPNPRALGHGSLGIGVELIEACGPGAGAEVAAPAQLGARLSPAGAIYLKAWVDGGGRDLRAFVVGGVVEAAIERVAPPGEFRTNVHLGGCAREVALGEEAARIAISAARALGLDYAGVDLVETAGGMQVLEVNGTPLFRGVLEATGRDMSEPIVAHVLRRARAAGTTGQDEGAAWWRRHG